MATGRPESDDPRRARYVWVWRGFVGIAAVAAAIAGVLAAGGATEFAVVWGVIALAWLGIALGIRRMHASMDDQEFRRFQR